MELGHRDVAAAAGHKNGKREAHHAEGREHQAAVADIGQGDAAHDVLHAGHDVRHGQAGRDDLEELGAGLKRERAGCGGKLQNEQHDGNELAGEAERGHDELHEAVVHDHHEQREQVELGNEVHVEVEHELQRQAQQQRLNGADEQPRHQAAQGRQRRTGAGGDEAVVERLHDEAVHEGAQVQSQADEVRRKARAVVLNGRVVLVLNLDGRAHHGRASINLLLVHAGHAGDAVGETVGKLLGAVAGRHEAVVELLGTVVELGEAVVEVGGAVIELAGTVEQVGSTVVELLGAVLGGHGTVKKLAGAVVERIDAVGGGDDAEVQVGLAREQRLGAVNELSGSVNSRADAVVELLGAVSELGGAGLQVRSTGIELGGAVLELPGALVELGGAVVGGHDAVVQVGLAGEQRLGAG